MAAAMRSLTKRLADDIEAAIAEPVDLDPDLYADELAVLEGQQ